MKVIILAGGGGTRLWPLSTEEIPKQFSFLPNLSRSLFQLTLLRANLITTSRDIYVVTSSNYAQLVLEQSEAISIQLNNEQIFFESSRKNTLPAIVAGVYFSKASSDEKVLVLPSDHIFGDDLAFSKQVQLLSQQTELPITLFGVSPTSPHTGYGYIESLSGSEINEVVSFKEKPDLETAKRFVEKGYYWNAGIFMFSNGVLKKELKNHQPELYELFESFDPIEAFNQTAVSTSIDYGLLEKANGLLIQELDSEWIDLGSWDAYVDYFDNNSNDISSIDGLNNSVVSFTSQEIVVIGLDDIIVVNHPNGILVTKKGRSQKVNKRKK